MKTTKILNSTLSLFMILIAFTTYAQKQPKEIRLLSSGHQLYVKDYPGEEPAFVMVHGFPDNHHIYDDLAPLLSQTNRRVIVFDFLGFGDSEKPDGFKYSFDQQLADLEAVANGLNLKKFTPVAHDAGGPAVINYARLHPDRMHSIVLLNTYYAQSPTLKLPEFIALNAAPEFKKLAVALMTNPEQRRWVLNFQADRFLENATPAIRKKFKDFLLPVIIDNFDTKGSGPAFIGMTADLYPNVEQNTRAVADLSKIAVPVKIIWGGGDPYLNMGVAQEFAKIFKNSEIHILPLGHWPQLDDPKAVADLMTGKQIKQ
jgi:pimeloyl-ACP methyl ester carboxylesterase